MSFFALYRAIASNATRDRSDHLSKTAHANERQRSEPGARATGPATPRLRLGLGTAPRTWARSHGRVIASRSAVWLLGGLVLSASGGCRSFDSGGWARREKSVRPGINDNYKNADVETWISRFESESREIYQQRDKIVRSVGAKPGTVMADIGAGTGFLTLLFARQVGESGKVFAVDITPEFLEHIDMRVREQGLNNVQTIQCREDSAELPPTSIDLAFLCDTYHHFEYPRSTMSSIHRALKTGGELVVIDFKRIPEVSREWVLGHVRADQDAVTKEIVAVGFELIGGRTNVSYLDENYLLRFRKMD